MQKGLVVGLCGLAIASSGYLVNKLLKSEPKQKQYQPVWALLGDVGGTNIRFQLVLVKPPLNQPLETFKKENYRVQNYENFADSIRDFLKDCPHKPEVAAIGIAGPVFNNKVVLANVRKWGQLNGNQLANQLKIRQFVFLNDFQAISYSLLIIDQKQLVSLNGLKVDQHQVRGVMGPGTGLGTKVLFTTPFRKRQRTYVLASQGGHTDYLLIDEQTSQYFEFFKKQKKHFYISRQRSFCGPSIPVMFKYFASKFPQAKDADTNPTSQYIIKKCKEQGQYENPDSLYAKTLNLFLKLYYVAIGNFIGHHLCTGGLYLVGSLTNAVAQFIKGQEIIAPYLKRHPQIAEALLQTPIILCKQDDLGLKGAYVMARRIISDKQHE